VRPPDCEARLEILQVLTSKLELTAAARDELPKIASACSGYVGADLAAIIREAALAAMATSNGRFDANGDAAYWIAIEPRHFHGAMTSVRPAAFRSLWSADAPSTAWADIGGLEQVT
jgi:transitional endoplasmic reticulum ATPase